MAQCSANVASCLTPAHPYKYIVVCANFCKFVALEHGYQNEHREAVKIVSDGSSSETASR